MRDFSYTLELSDDIVKRINARRKANKRKASLIEWRVQRQGCRYVPLPDKTKKNPPLEAFWKPIGDAT
jgi:hypothetical protein